MGWANCGTDSQGRPIGYAHPARCDHTSCNTKINRGLAYACGGMHGEDEISCEKYFCAEHRQHWIPIGDRVVQVCAECDALWRKECPEDAAKFDAE